MLQPWISSPQALPDRCFSKSVCKVSYSKDWISLIKKRFFCINSLNYAEFLSILSSWISIHTLNIYKLTEKSFSQKNCDVVKIFIGCISFLYSTWVSFQPNLLALWKILTDESRFYILHLHILCFTNLTLKHNTAR